MHMFVGVLRIVRSVGTLGGTAKDTKAVVGCIHIEQPPAEHPQEVLFW
jgi:hypothetical protein